MISAYFSKIQYTESLAGDKIRTSDSYRNTTWFALNNLFKYHEEAGNISHNFMKIAKPKAKSDPIKPKYQLTADDFSKMLQKIPGKNPFVRTRNKAILLVLMTTGMRREALCQIDVDDIDLEKHKIKIIDKGEKEHLYDIESSLEECIKKWLIWRSQVKAQSKALFISMEGERLSSNCIYNMVQEDTYNALGKKLSPHKIRAGYCTILYSQTHDIEFVRRAVGQANVSTTQRYIVTDGKEKERAAKILQELIKI